MAFSLTMRMPTPGDTLEGEQPFDVCARAARGDRAAIVELYNEHHAHVRAFARRLVGDEALAEDLVHEVFLCLPKALAGFRGECSVRTYVISVAARRAHKQIRTAARRRAMESRLAREPLPSPPSPDENAQRRELAALLTRALDELPVDQRVAFVLCEVEERTSTEVGDMLGEKDGTIRARVFHAKKKLREALERLAPDLARSRSEGGAP